MLNFTTADYAKYIEAQAIKSVSFCITENVKPSRKRAEQKKKRAKKYA